MSTTSTKRKEIFDREMAAMTADQIGINYLTPTLQQWSSMGVTAGHLMRLLKDGQAQARIARSLMVGGWQVSESEAKVLHLLGPENFVIAEEAMERWQLRDRLKLEPSSKNVPYSEDTLKECRKQNQAGRACWRLVYILDLCPQDIFDLQHFAFGRNREEIAKHGTDLAIREWNTVYKTLEFFDGYLLIDTLPRKLKGENFEFVPSQDDKWFETRVLAPPTVVLQMWIHHYLNTGSVKLFDYNQEAIKKFRPNPLPIVHVCSARPGSFVVIRSYTPNFFGENQGRPYILLDYSTYPDVIPNVQMEAMTMLKPELGNS
jgi:hypothetical protein